MNEKWILPLIICILYLSCMEEEKNNLIGIWKYSRPSENSEYKPPPGSNMEHGFNFYSKDSLEYLPGFFEFKKDSITQNSYKEYIGSKTIYRKINNKIKIKSLKTKEWLEREIVELTEDSLILKGKKGSRTKYIKLKENKITKQIDRIILSTSGCFGSCPIMDISISRNGEVVYIGEEYTKNKGIFEFKLNRKSTKEIFRRFEYSEVNKLEDGYVANHTDDETIITTYVIDDKIIKTIHDYGNRGPNSLLWAYELLRYVPNKIELHEINMKKLLPFMAFSYSKIIGEGEKILLKKSEKFLLWDEIRKGVLSEKKEGLNYEVRLNGNSYFKDSNQSLKIKNNRIKTDGRYYEYIVREKLITKDIGYNFLKLEYIKQ